MKHDNIDISVVIGFKDWGIERLLISITSIEESFGNRKGEIILSDYGSETFADDELREIIESVGAIYIRTVTDGTWSRSRAVNAGYNVARGAVVVATDADMIFTPQSMEIIASEVIADPTTAIVLQCRDLPEGFDHVKISTGEFSFDQLHRVSQIRPRWGMGGMFAAHRDVIAAVGGYDNRMHTYGGEDLDLAVRVRRGGYRLRWLEDDSVRMYHIWHEPTIKSVEQNVAAKAAVAANHVILKNDKSWKRNATLGEFDELKISWAKDSLHVIEPGEKLDEAARATFVAIMPTKLTCRHDFGALISQELDYTNRALVGQAVAFVPPKHRSNANLEVAFRLPVLILDSRFIPLITPYFVDGNWDIHGAARRLHAAAIKMNASAEVFGLVENSVEQSKLARSHNWEWESEFELYPALPDQQQVTDFLKNLPLNALAQVMQSMDLRIISEDVADLEQLKPVTEVATEWTHTQNLLTGDSYFEAILLNASDEEASVIQGLEVSLALQVSQIAFREALTTIERLGKTNSLVGIAEKIRAGREVETGAVQICWVDVPLKLEESDLTEARQIGGDFLEIHNDDLSATLWVSDTPLMDVQGTIVSPLSESKFFEKWNTGIFGPVPVEALVELGGRLNR